MRDSSFQSVMPAPALPLFLSGFLFRQFCDIPVFAEYIWALLVLVSLTISNAILVRNYFSGTVQKTVPHSTQPQVLQQKDVSVAARDIYTVDNDVRSNEIPKSVLDLSGTYKLESKSNYEEFLASQGVGWAIRKAAMQAVPTNVITHDLLEHIVTIRVEGIISTQTTYKINGDPIETHIQTRVFSDTVKYLDSGDGVQVTKVCHSEGYYVLVKRQLTSCKQIMTVTSTAIWPDRKDQCEQIYRKIEL